MAAAKTKHKKKTNTTTSSRSKSGKLTAAQMARDKEILGIVIIAVALLLFVSYILAPTDADAAGMGAVSLLLIDLMRFFAGSAAIALPFLLLVFGVLVLLNRNKNENSNLRLAGLIMMFAALLGLLHLGMPMQSFGAYMLDAVSGNGGGIIGGLLAFALISGFGIAGAVIILLAVILIGLLIFTKTSIVSVFAYIKQAFSSLLGIINSGEEDQPQNEIATKTALKKNAEALMREAADDQRRRSLIRNTFDAAPLISNSDTVISPPPSQTGFSREYLQDIDKPEAKADAHIVTKPSVAKAAKAVTASSASVASVVEVSTTPSSEPSPVMESYVLPDPSLISRGEHHSDIEMKKAIAESIEILETTLADFGVKAEVVQVVPGPAVTRYELQPAPGVKVARITSLADDIALTLAAPAVRIEAPIPGKSAIGIEVARRVTDTVYFREVIESKEFIDSPAKLSFALGKNIGGESIVGDLAKMPHLLISGATGSGKSICLNSIICSLLFKAKPNEVKLMLIDPKKVEMTAYRQLPHLLVPIVTDSKKAASSLKWVVTEMEDRYSLFAASATKDFSGYNAAKPDNPLPYIVVIIDELADLMLVAKKDVEESICRIAQLARAAGIHLVVATQRPSVDVITGLIKANIPSRIAFAVSSNTDSRTILDMAGAEKLLGRGDMLYYPIGANKPMRIQGTFIAEKDVAKLIDFCAKQTTQKFSEQATAAAVSNRSDELDEDMDELFYKAGTLIIASKQASTSYLQRRLAIGNPRAARLMDILECKGVVGGPNGSKTTGSS